MTGPGDLPNFFLLGAAKAGTTSLHAYLDQHPEIFLTEAKEPHFFDYDAEYAGGVERYVGRHFDGASSFPARGEATPSYLSSESVPARMKEVYGEQSPRFLVLLRDPVARAWSHYLHRARNAEETLSFEAALEAEEERLRTRPQVWAGYYADGLYATHLERWWRHFPRSRFLLLWTADLAADPGKAVQDAMAFLGVDPEFSPDVTQRRNAAGVPRSRWLMRLLARPSPLQSLGKALVPRGLRRRLVGAVRSANVRTDTEREPVPAEMERRLRRRYAPDVRRLMELTGRDLAAWLPDTED